MYLKNNLKTTRNENNKFYFISRGTSIFGIM